MAGMTLIELIVTVSIAAILLTLGVPSFQTLITNNRLSVASNDLLFALNVAKSEAIRRNASVRFCLKSTDLSWKVVNMAGTDIRKGVLSSNIVVTPANLDTTSVADHACVRFRSDGLSYGIGSALITNGSFTLTLGGKTRAVDVKTGAINVVAS